MSVTHNQSRTPSVCAICPDRVLKSAVMFSVLLGGAVYLLGCERGAVGGDEERIEAASAGPDSVIVHVRDVDTLQRASRIIEVEHPEVARIAESEGVVISGQGFRIPESMRESMRDVDTPPRARRCVEPEYPERLRRAGIEGVVVVHVVITATGQVGSATVFKEANPGLHKPAVEAAMQWVFEPAMKDGEPVACEYLIPMAFKLDS